jgi:hypothetical protein
MSLVDVLPPIDEVQREREIKKRVSRVMAGTATSQDKSELQQLIEERTKNMRSDVFEKIDALRRRVRGG